MKLRIGIIAFVLTNLLACTTHEGVKSKEEVISNAHEPYLHKGADGHTYLSWIKEIDSSNWELSYKQLNDDLTWSDTKTLAEGNDWFVNWADYPHILVQENSRLGHILKKNKKGTYNYDIQMILENEVGRTEFVLHDDSISAEHGFVSMEAAPNNEYFVTWLDGRNTVPDSSGNRLPMTIRACWLDEQGNKHDEFELDESVCDCCQTHSFYGPNGPTVVYRNRTKEEIRDIYLTTFRDETWTEPINISEDQWEIAGCPVNGPQIVGNSTWQAVAWFNGKDQTNEVKIRFSKDDWLTKEPIVNINAKESLGRIDLEILNEDKVLVCWMEYNSDNMDEVEILIKSISSQGQASKPIVLASNKNSRRAGFPQIALSEGQLVLAYTNLMNGTSELAVKTIDLKTLAL